MQLSLFSLLRVYVCVRVGVCVVCVCVERSDCVFVNVCVWVGVDGCVFNAVTNWLELLPSNVKRTGSSQP